VSLGVPAITEMALSGVPSGLWANKKCALSGALFRRVEVPLALK